MFNIKCYIHYNFNYLLQNIYQNMHNFEIYLGYLMSRLYNLKLKTRIRHKSFNYINNNKNLFHYHNILVSKDNFRSKCFIILKLLRYHRKYNLNLIHHYTLNMNIGIQHIRNFHCHNIHQYKGIYVILLIYLICWILQCCMKYKLQHFQYK